jgi:hypothetical protein
VNRCNKVTGPNTGGVQFWGKLLFVTLSCIMLLCGCCGSSEPKKRSELEREFQAEFGFGPPSAVRELRCKIVRVGDTWGKWLLFTHDESTHQRIVTNGFTAADALNSSDTLWHQDLTSQNPNAPDWWSTPGANQVRIYYKEGHPKDFAGFIYLWIDDTNKRVYANSSAWH